MYAFILTYAHVHDTMLLWVNNERMVLHSRRKVQYILLVKLKK